MVSFLLDTTCMIAAVCRWHAYHSRAAQAIASRLASGEKLVMAGPALIETYSVLTRLPIQHRLTPNECQELLRNSFLGDATEIVCLDAHAYRTLFESAPSRRIAGGQIYDAIIYECARAAKVDALLTINERHFRPLANDGIEIVVPA